MKADCNCSELVHVEWRRGAFCIKLKGKRESWWRCVTRGLGTVWVM